MMKEEKSLQLELLNFDDCSNIIRGGLVHAQTCMQNVACMASPIRICITQFERNMHNYMDRSPAEQNVLH